MSLKAKYDSFWNYATTISVLVACTIVYYAMWIAHYGLSTHIAQNPLSRWIVTLTPIQQLLLFMATPVVGAILGGIIIGVIVVLLAETILKAIFKH